MNVKPVILFTALTLAFQLLPPLPPARAQNHPTPDSLIVTIQRDLESLRGKRFKHPVKVRNQSLAEFGHYLDRMLDKQFPEKLQKNYGKVVKKLGLYRGPEITDFKALAKMVMQSQAAAYYDPETRTFYVVMQNLPAQTLQAVYAHELYHGLQDQYFDLQHYVLSPRDAKLSDDELMARQAVVEGEATFIMTAWSLRKMFGNKPADSILEMAINAPAQMDATQLMEMVKRNALPLAQSAEMKNAAAALEKIPRFLLETLVGAYLKGMAFLYEIKQHGWKQVDELYSRPPRSTEQILHPQKWVDGENPVKLSWPDFSEEKVFHGWELLEANTLGEVQWRIIFAEHGLGELGKQAAKGWAGDTFAVLENRRSRKLLLLIYSTWDSEAEANEFEQAYRQLLRVKYPEQDENTVVQLTGRDVLIIEGGANRDNGRLLAFLKRVKKQKS